MRKLLSGVGLMLAVLLFSANTERPEADIEWITFDQLPAKYAAEKRPIMIDLYTDWCGWCKVMDRTTYKDRKVADYVNQKFYAIRFNAETKANVTFNGKLMRYNPAYRAHDVALYLTAGNLSFPTTVFLADPGASPAPLPGYLKPGEIEAPMKFFGERISGTKSFDAFYRGFKRSW